MNTHTPPCADNPSLFESRNVRDHAKARALCATCPMVQHCLHEALTIAGQNAPGPQRGPDGTWGGLLWSGGHIRPTGRPACGTDGGYNWHRRHRQTPCDACKVAHRRKAVA